MYIEKVKLRYVANYPRKREEAKGVSWFKEHFDYDADSGQLCYKKQGAHPNNKPGKEIPLTKIHRHETVVFWRGKDYQAARVAYICMTQKIPHLVLHRDGDPSNIRWDNLIHLTREEELQSRRRVDVDLFDFDLTKLNS